MIVVSDSSPLITLSKIKQLELLPVLYRRIYVTPEVYGEVVITGAGMPGSNQIAQVKWITVTSATAVGAFQNSGLGSGERNAIQLAKELSAGLILVDDKLARVVARQEGLKVAGCVGVLEDAFRLTLLSDLAACYRQLLDSGAYVSRKMLAKSLESLGLPPL